MKEMEQDMKKEDLIEPTLAAGLRDYLPSDMIPRNNMLDAIRVVFERFGFLPLETPGIERKPILVGNEETRKQIFSVSTSTTNESDLALRFDLTVPLARVFARYRSDLGVPFKRYQVGKVWRGERPQAGRFREFTQFDADIVGSDAVAADAEIVSLMCETMKALGFERFVIRVNTRRILNGLAEYAGFPAERTDEVIRVLDKIDKIEWQGVADVFSGKDASAFFNPLSAESIEALRKFVDLRGISVDDTLDQVAKLMAGSELAAAGVAELRELAECVRALGVPDENWTVDLSVARGLGYYTGPVFETILTDLPGIGSVFSGGRYDGLVERFSPSGVPATGASVGVDRLFAAMEQLKLVPEASTLVEVGVLNFDPQARMACQKLVGEIRRAGAPAELYLGPETSLKAQLIYFVKKGVQFAVVLGGTEMEKGVVQIKNLTNRGQQEMDIALAPAFFARFHKERRP